MGWRVWKSKSYQYFRRLFRYSQMKTLKNYVLQIYASETREKKKFIFIMISLFSSNDDENKKQSKFFKKKNEEKKEKF